MPMVKAPFNGQLNSNEIFSAIFNMIISQEVTVPEIAHNYGELVDRCKVDGTMYGDTKLYYATDVLSSREWLNDSEAANLLDINRPDDPKCQAITIDQFRQIDITVDNYLSKRAWSTEGAFSQFNSVILGMLSTTKRLHEVTTFNTYAGTIEGGSSRATLEIALSDISATGEEKNRLEAQTIAKSIADLMFEMKDYSREFNDYGFMRAYTEGELMFIVNSKWANRITYMDLPTIFHKENLNKLTENILPARYFGVVTDSTMAAEGGPIASNVVVANKGVRALVEKTWTSGGTKYHVFPGDLIPAGTSVGSSGATFSYDEAYVEKDDIICKVISTKAIKMMSGFETGTEFFNPRSLTQNHYLTWGYSYPDRLLDQPLVTIVAD